LGNCRIRFQSVNSDITGFFDDFWVRARGVVARVAPGGKSFVSPGRCHASKCLLRRQTVSQRDSVHPAGRWLDDADGIAPGCRCNNRETMAWRPRGRMTMRMTMIFKSEGTRARGAGPDRRCAGGLGPARIFISWGQPIAIRDEYGRNPENRVVSG